LRIGFKAVLREEAGETVVDDPELDDIMPEE